MKLPASVLGLMIALPACHGAHAQADATGDGGTRDLGTAIATKDAARTWTPPPMDPPVQPVLASGDEHPLLSAGLPTNVASDAGAPTTTPKVGGGWKSKTKPPGWQKRRAANWCGPCGMG